MEAGLIPAVRKIVVLRPMAVGDVVMGLPALVALRQAYPDAEIVLLGSAWETGFLPGRAPAVDRVEVIPQMEGLLIEPGQAVRPAEQAAFFQRMQAERFDLACQLFGGGRHSNPFTRRLGARVSIGARAPESIPLDRWIPYVFYQHDTLRCLETVALAGAHTAALEPRLHVLPADRAEVAPILAGLKRPFVVIHAGSSDERRCWPAERFAQVADHCSRQLDVDVVLTGVGAEAERVERVVAAMRETPINLCQRLSLGGLLALLAEARLVLTNNTGPLHLALAVGAPAVGLFWAEQVVNTLPLTRSTFHPLIAWDRHCPLCGRYVDKAEFDNQAAFPCQHHASFLEEVRVPEVVTAVERSLEWRAAQRHVNPPLQSQTAGAQPAKG